MRSNCVWALVLLLCCMSSVFCASSVFAEDGLRVVAATNDLGALARAVGGELVEIDVIARPDRDPHALEVRPSALRKAAKADLYLSVGLSLDAWSSEIVRGSRNRSLVFVDCSKAIAPIEVPEGQVDASMGDVHPGGNPHYWLDPKNGAAIARSLAGHFSTADPANAEVYQQNAELFAADIVRRMPEWTRRLSGQSFVEFHRTWAYLADRFEMQIVGRVEPLPGIPPTARHLARLSETVKQSGVSVVVREPFHSDSALDFLQREVGIRGVVLASSCPEPTPESYLGHFDRIATVLGGEGTEAATGGSR